MKKIALTFILMLLVPVIAQAAVTVADVVKHIPTDVSVQAGASTTDLNRNVITLSYSLRSDQTNDVLTSITIDDTGTLAAGEADLKVYVNPMGRNSTRGAFLVVNQPSWSAASGTINFSRNIALTQNVKAFVFIVYDLRSTAAGRTIQTSVSSMGLAAGSGSGTSVPINQTSNLNNVVAKTACYDDVKLNQCGMCHNYQGYYQMFYPHSSATSRKGHEKHVGLNRFECFICHNNANRYHTRYTSVAPQHMNNAINVGPKIWDNVSSAGGLGVGHGSYNSSTRVCSNVYCHSNGAGTRVNSPAWGTKASGCTVCHGTPPNTGAHNAHWTRITGLTSPGDCGICHRDGGTGTFHHADGHVDVLFDPAYNDRNLTATYNTGAKTCSNVSCHGGVTTPAWNSATGAYRQTVTGAAFTSENNTWLRCEMCHVVDNITSGQETNVSRWNSARSGKHNAHAVTGLASMRAYTGIVNGVNFGRKRMRVSVCYVCHNNAHFDGTANDYRWTKASISDYHFSINPGGTNNTIGGSAQRGGGTVGANIFDTYVDNSTTAIALNTSPTQNVFYMRSTADIYQSGTCNNTDCHGGGTWSYVATLDCTTCHSKVIRGRTANVIAEFSMPSRHVQGVAVNSHHCYRCHWEADNNAGTIVKNALYHGDNKAQLVIYDSTNNARPTTANSATLTVFNRATSATSLRVNAHCLGCHNEGGKGKAIFPGDTRTTNQYAWDGSSIQARYMAYRRYSSHVYNAVTYNVVPNKIKTSSSHYYMNQHQRGVAVGAAWSDDQSTILAAGTFDAQGRQGSVGCLDCHNSHGSNIPFGTFGYTSYSSFTGKHRGGILKQTWANTHGYGDNYTPTERNLNVTGGLWAIWSAQAALCFDCHLGPDKAITAYLGSTYSSWSSVTTLPPDSRGVRRNYISYGRNAGNIIAGYYDPINYEAAITNRASIHGRGRWYIDLNTANTTYGNNGYSYVQNQRNNSAAFWFGEFSYKRGTIIGTHFKKYDGAYVQGYTPRDWKNSANSGNTRSDLRGMCTPCHDPHGVNALNGSPYLANIRYYSPQLKGMWLTGLYYEDRPGNRDTSANSEGTYAVVNTFSTNTLTNTRVAPRMVPTKRLSRPKQTGNGYGFGLNDGLGQDGFFIDDNTFGVTINNGTTAVELFSNNNYNLVHQNYWFDNWTNGQVHPFRTGGSVTVNMISESESQFAGLCLGCHPKSVLVNTLSSHNNRRASFQTHAHKTVKGWAATANSPANADIVPNYYINRASNAAGLTNAYTTTNNFGNISMSPLLLYANGGTAGIRGLDAPNVQVGIHFYWGLHLPKQADTNASNNIQVQYHNFPCSKCHTVHTSRLPRLMKTNCLDVRQSKDVANNWASGSNLFRQKFAEGNNNWYIRMIYTGTNNSPGTSGTTANLLIWNPARAVRCHNSPLVMDNVNQTRWNDVTPWGN